MCSKRWPCGSKAEVVTINSKQSSKHMAQHKLRQGNAEHSGASLSETLSGVPGQHMVRTSKTDHFFKLAPFWSPLTDLIDFGMAGKLLTSATR